MLAGAAAAALTPSGEGSACAPACGMLRSLLDSAVGLLFVAGVEAAALPSRALALPSRSFSLLVDA